MNIGFHLIAGYARLHFTNWTCYFILSQTRQKCFPGTLWLSVFVVFILILSIFYWKATAYTAQIWYLNGKIVSRGRGRGDGTSSTEEKQPNYTYTNIFTWLQPKRKTKKKNDFFPFYRIVFIINMVILHTSHNLMCVWNAWTYVRGNVWGTQLLTKPATTATAIPTINEKKEKKYVVSRHCS